MPSIVMTSDTGKAFNHAMGFNCVTSLLYHSWPPFFIQYSSFLLWLVAFLLLLASWTPPSPFVPLHLALVVVYGKKKKENKAHKMGPFGVSGKGGLCCNKCFNKQLTVITPCHVWHQKKRENKEKNKLLNKSDKEWRICFLFF